MAFHVHSGVTCVFQLFDRVRDEQPDFAEKIVAVSSDLTRSEEHTSELQSR